MVSQYTFPPQAAFGRVLPKSKIYEHAAPGTKVKELFVREVEKIIWSYKLSQETINIAAKNSVREIQVFTVFLKTDQISHDVLLTIDKAIPSPILFVVCYENRVRYIAAYKRPSGADKNKWVVSSYFEAEWLKEDAERIKLPVVLDLETLYWRILRNIIPIPVRDKETIADFVGRIDRLRSKERELVKVQTHLIQEIQFNRKVKINTELKNLKQEVEELTR